MDIPSILFAVGFELLPPVCALGALPSVLLARPLLWAFADTEQPVPTPALSSNVVWNLITNLTVAATLVVAAA